MIDSNDTQEVAFVARINDLLDAHRGPDWTALENDLRERGWHVPDWPLRWGGCQRTPRERFLWHCALARRDIQRPNACAVDIVAPILLRYAAAETLAECLPAIRDDGTSWSVAALHSNTPLPTYVDGLLQGEISTQDAGLGQFILCLVQRESQVELVAIEATGVERESFIGLDGQPRARLSVDGVVPWLLLAAGDEAQRGVLIDEMCGHEFVALGRLGRLHAQMVHCERLALTLSQEDSAWRGLHGAQITFQTIQALYLRYVDAVQRAQALPFPLQMLNVKCADLSAELGDLSAQLQGYFTLLEAPLPGVNEPALGPRLAPAERAHADPFAPRDPNPAALIPLAMDQSGHPALGPAGADRDALAALLWPPGESV